MHTRFPPRAKLELLAMFCLWMPGGVCAAQEIDTMVTADSRRPSNIAGEIADPAERSAYVSLFVAGSPRQALANAEQFLQRFPQSAYLARAYETAARGCFDLDKPESGLDYARQSLRIYPENPLLLVAVADIEARVKRNDEAIQTARTAIEDLDRFARPIAIAASDWPQVSATQKATAYFAMGRGLIQKALSMPRESTGEHGGNDRDALLSGAVAALVEARALRPDDSEIAYLLGESQFLRGASGEAAMEFAFVSAKGGVLAETAKRRLMLIYETGNKRATGGAQPNDTFEEFAKREAELRTAAPRGVRNPTTIATVPRPARYAGSEACKSCHGGIYRQWKMTGMARMLQPYASENVIGDFQQNNTFFAGDEVSFRNGELQVVAAKEPVLFARMVKRNGRHYFDIKQSDGSWHSYPVDYTIGSKWQQAYATILPNGQIQVFPIQYNTIQRRWVNYWKVIDGPGTVRANPLNWETFRIETDYRANCAVCHTSQLRNVIGGGFDAEHLDFREPGIGCEQCHGPSSAHIAEIKTGSANEETVDPLTPPVRFRELNNRDFVSICAQCHMQSNVHDPDTHGDLNFSSTGRFYLRNPSAPYEEFSRKGFFKDGRFSQTTFIVEAFERSKCFRDGNATCGSCHNPHDHSGAGNNTSLKFKDDPDHMCLQCHKQFSASADIAAHSHHAVNSEGSRCVACHMPRIVDALLFRARSHQIDDIPSEEMTARFGPIDSPNACLLCHTDKDVVWLQAQVRSWWPRTQRATERASTAR